MPVWRERRAGELVAEVSVTLSTGRTEHWRCTRLEVSAEGALVLDLKSHGLMVWAPGQWAKIFVPPFNQELME